MKKKKIIKNIAISVIIIILGLSVFFTMKLAKTELINNNVNEKMEMPEPPDMNQNSNTSNKENGDFKPDNMKPNEMKANEINSNEIKLST